MEQRPARKTRETLVSIVLAIVLGGVLYFFLNLVTLGLMFQVSAAILFIVIIGYLHYLVWGHGLSQEVAGERAIEKLKEEMESEELEARDERIRHLREH